MRDKQSINIRDGYFSRPFFAPVIQQSRRMKYIGDRTDDVDLRNIC